MLKAGKLDSEVLKKIVFENIKYRRPEVITRPGIGEDCAEIDFGDRICVMSTDPITASVKDIGRLSIHISCNDIASNGIQPVGIMLCVLLPLGTTEDDISCIMKQAATAAETMEVEIIGGHTEITPAVNQPVICSTAVGIDMKENEKREIEDGDLIFMTGTCGLEGTGIIVSEKEDELRGFLSDDEIEDGKAYLDHVSVVKAGVCAGRIGVSAMHDITEGGILGAVWEMCQVGNLGAYIYEKNIPVTELTKKIAEKYSLDYLRLISSGCMMIIAGNDKKEEILKEVEDAIVIGEIRNSEEGVIMEDKDGNSIEIMPPAADEIYKVMA